MIVFFRTMCKGALVKVTIELGLSYRESGELLSASGAQQTEEDQQWADAHPVAAWQGVAPNYARSKMYSSAFLRLFTQSDFFGGVSQDIPCAQKIREHWSRGCRFISIRLFGFVCHTVCEDTLFISGRVINALVSLTFSPPSVSLLTFSLSSIRLLFSTPPPSTHHFLV